MTHSLRVRVYAVGAALLATSACRREARTDAAVHTHVEAPTETLDATIRTWLVALAHRDLRAVAARLGSVQLVRTEIRQARFETDERTGETAAGASAFAAWMERTAPSWVCTSTSPTCRWPLGLRFDGTWNCFGDCCDVRYVNGLQTGALHVRRVCMAGREGPSRTLSLLSLVEDR